MAEDGRNQVRDVLLRTIAAPVRLSVVCGLTALGAGVLVGRELARLASPLLSGWGAGTPPTRHHAGRISESAKAAEQAARASGLLSSRRR